MIIRGRGEEEEEKEEGRGEGKYLLPLCLLNLVMVCNLLRARLLRQNILKGRDHRFWSLENLALNFITHLDR